MSDECDVNEHLQTTKIRDCCDLPSAHVARYFPLLEKLMSRTDPVCPFNVVKSQLWE